MDFVSQLAEERIKQSIADGDFDHLEGKGKPLPKDSLTGVPDDLRMSYRIMKNSGYLPKEVILNKEIASLRDLLKCCHHPDEQENIRQKLSEKEVQFRLLVDKKNWKQNSAFRRYSSKIQKLF